MASAMNHTMQTCQNLCTMTQAQMIDEDRIDPFPSKTTLELEEMLDACCRTKEILSRESLIYSADADFSKYSDAELVAMNAFVKENTRMLSIILAGGAQHFWNGQGLSTVQELKNMYPFIDDKVKEFLMLDKIMDTLDVKMRYGRQNMTPKAVSPANHPELLRFTAVDANRAPSSQESLLRLAAVCEQFAEQCRLVSHTRSAKADDRTRKMQVRERLLEEVDSVLPMLRSHVLKIGLSKSQLQTKEGAKAGDGSTQARTSSHKLTSLFTFGAVEDAHRSVEDCRERLMQELLYRRSRVERRLKKEEEAEMLLEKQRMEKFRLTGQMPGTPASYQSLMDEDTRRQKQRDEQDRTLSPKGDKADRGKSPPRGKSPGARSDDEKAKGSSRNQTSSRSPSPKGKSKAKSKAKADGSPRKSPSASPKGKARAKKA